MKKIVFIVLLLSIVVSGLPLYGDWVEDAQFKFKINVPNNWQKSSMNDGTDRIHTFLSPDENLAVRVRAFTVNDRVTVDIIANLFKTNIMGECEQLAFMENEKLNGYSGKIGVYKGIYSGTEVAAGAFFTIQNSIAYIVWSMTPISMFDAKAPQSDAITNTFTILDDTPPLPSQAHTSSVELAGTFNDAGLGYSINYPADWGWTKTKPHIVIFSGMEGTPAYYATVNIQNLASTLMGGNFNTVDEVIAYFNNQFKTGAADLQMTTPEEFTFQSAGRNVTGKAYQMSYTRQNESFQQMMVIAPRFDQKIFYAWMFTAPTEDYETYYPIAREMLNTWVIK